jgi:hypothetical protein
MLRKKSSEHLGRIANLARRRVLTGQTSSGIGELRKIEWTVRETARSLLASMQNISKRNMPVSLSSPPSECRTTETPKERALANARKRSLDERDKAQRRLLLSVLDNAEAIISVEPNLSLPDALHPIANELKAHYNEIKKRSRDQKTPINSTLTDYWVLWATISTLQNGSTLDNRILKYASKDLKERISRIAEFSSQSIVERAQRSIGSVRHK